MHRIKGNTLILTRVRVRVKSHCDNDPFKVQSFSTFTLANLLLFAAYKLVKSTLTYIGDGVIG